MRSPVRAAEPIIVPLMVVLVILGRILPLARLLLAVKPQRRSLVVRAEEAAAAPKAAPKKEVGPKRGSKVRARSVGGNLGVLLEEEEKQQHRRPHAAAGSGGGRLTQCFIFNGRR